MKSLLLLCAALLLIGIIDLPIGYYTFLRIIVTIGVIVFILNNFEKESSMWTIFFGIVGILFNPIFPIYLYDKEIWISIDLVAGILFGIKAFTLTSKNE